MVRVTTLLSLLLLGGLAAAAPAGTKPDTFGAPEFHTTTQAAVAAFPAGLMVGHEAEMRIPLWGSVNPLLDGAHISVLGHGQLTPSFVRLGPGVRFAPLAVWDVTARWYATSWFGTFTSLLPVDPTVDSTPAVRREMMRAGEQLGGLGMRADLETRLKGKVGPVVAVLEGVARYNHVKAAGDTPLYYFWEPGDMLNVSATGWVFHRNAYLFVQAIEHGKPTHRNFDDRRLWIGATAFWTTAQFTEDENIRIGPTVVWKPARGPSVPQLLIASQGWVKSRSQPELLPPYTAVLASWSQ
jgi:hypothetical protein